MLKRTTAFIYADQGVSSLSLRASIEYLEDFLPKHYSIRTIKACELKNTSWEKEAMLLAFPGGRDVPYYSELKGEPCLRIRRFVEEGGLYLGICAGAYFACATFSFEKGFPLEILATRELRFFHGEAIGPALGLNKFCYDTEKGMEAPLIDNLSSKESLYVYYNGGCLFDKAEDYSNVKICARYCELDQKPAAIILCQVGKGKALLSGVHFEITASHLTQNAFLQDNKKSLLLTSEEKRKTLSKQLLRDLLSH